MRVIGLHSEVEVKTSSDIFIEFFKDHWFAILENKKTYNFDNFKLSISLKAPERVRERDFDNFIQTVVISEQNNFE